MPIYDNRLQLSDAEAVAPGGFPGEWVQHDGGTMISLDTATFIEGAGSIADRISNARRGFLWQEDASRDWTQSVFYVWFNSGAANKLGLKEFGGVTMRFTGSDVNDWFEVYIDGSDTYGGGFKMAVVDIEAARVIAVAGALTSPAVGGNTNNSPPLTNAITRVGIIFDITSSAPGGSDNHWIDSIWRLPPDTPGIIVAGENTAVSPIRPYTWDDIVDAGDVADPTKAWGTVSRADGVIKLNTPVQFGSDGSPDDGDHDFEDSNVVIAWESQIVPDGFYGFSVVGDSANAQRFVAGVKTGSGDTAIGSQGWVVTAASDGPRWFLDCFDANLDDAQWHGCTLIHTLDFDLDNLLTEMRSCQLVDGQRIEHSRIASPRSGAEFQKNTIIAAVPIEFLSGEFEEQSPNDDVSYIHTSDPDKIRECTFLFSGEHAIEIISGGTFDFVGNIFTGFGAEGTKDAALHYAPVEEQGDLMAETTVNVKPGVESVGAYRFNDISGNAILYDGVAGIRFVDYPIIRRVSQPQFVSPDEEITVEIYDVTDLTEDAPSDGDVPLAVSKPRFVSDVEFDSFAVSPIENTILRFTFDPPFAPSSPASSQSPLMLWLGVTFRTEDEAASPNDGIGVGGLNFDESPKYFSDLDVRAKAGSPQPWTVDFGLFPHWLKAYDQGIIQGELTLDVSDAATPTMHNPVSPENVTINNLVSVTLTSIQPGTEIRVFPVESPINTTEIAGIESVGSPTEFTFSASAGLLVRIVVFHIDFVLPPANEFELTIPNESTSFPISQIIDRNYLNPA